MRTALVGKAGKGCGVHVWWEGGVGRYGGVGRGVCARVCGSGMGRGVGRGVCGWQEKGASGKGGKGGQRGSAPDAHEGKEVGGGTRQGEVALLVYACAAGW